MTIRFCTKCGKQFYAIGREVICPSCREAAAEATKKAAVERAKRASWTGESVPVRISGRASTVIRAYGKAHSLPFAAALDDLLKETNYFKGTGSKWEEIEPYKSRRRDKHATSTTETAQEGKQAGKPQDVPQDKQDGAQATSKQASKPQEVTKAAKKAVKTTAGKASKAGKGGKE